MDDPRHISAVRSIIQEVRSAATTETKQQDIARLRVTIKEQPPEICEDSTSIASLVSEDGIHLALKGVATRLRCDRSRGIQSSASYSTSGVALVRDLVREVAVSRSQRHMRFDRSVRLRVPTDQYTNGVEAEATWRYVDNEGRWKDMAIARRRWTDCETTIRSTELYLLFVLARQQAADSHADLAQDISVRILVTYCEWVRVVSATTTGNYIASVLEGREQLAGHMDIRLTRWFNVATEIGLYCVLCMALEGHAVCSSRVEQAAYKRKRRRILSDDGDEAVVVDGQEARIIRNVYSKKRRKLRIGQELKRQDLENLAAPL